MTALDSFNNADVMEKSARDAPDLKIFSFGAIVAATNNFSTENKLGQGGFGPVYKVSGKYILKDQQCQCPS